MPPSPASIANSLPINIKDSTVTRGSRINSGLSQHTIGGTPRTALTKLKAWEISPTSSFAPASFNSGPRKSATDLEDYLSEIYNFQRKHETRLFRVEQQHSRDHIATDTGDLKTLLDHLGAFPALRKVLGAFHRDTIDCQNGKAAAHYSPIIHDSPLLELCCLLKYVETHERPSPPLVKGCEGYSEVQRWSIRQMAFYQSHDSSRHFESALMINPSVRLVQDLLLQYKKSLTPAKTYENWMRLPLMVFESLAAGWPEYVSALYRAVEEVYNDASFTDPKEKRINEADTRSLQTCAELMDRLQQAEHVLRNNIAILETSLRVAKKRQAVAAHPSERELSLFESGLEDVITELQFQCNHIVLIMGRLDKTSITISNLIQLRGSHNMEQMTKRSILEARAVRIIALVTLFFIPPTFTAGFLQMEGLKIDTSASGHLIVDAEPKFLFFLAITLPLMVVVIGAWLIYDWHSTRKAKEGSDIDMI